MSARNRRLCRNGERAIYGQKDVEGANEYGAVQALLLTDEHWRKCDRAARQKNDELVESVKHSGGTVHIISSSLIYVREIKATGIAAILRFPLPAV